MRRLSGIKIRILLLALVAAITAGPMAVPASGAIEYYCYHCTVNGVPAVSATKYHYDNYMSVDYAGNLEIWFYNVNTGSTTCGLSTLGTLTAYRSCSNYATARCHTWGGTGDRVAVCDALY